MGNALLPCCVKNNILEEDDIDEETRRPCSDDFHIKDDDGDDEETWRMWSDLPDLVLHNILMHLRGIEAYISFIGVCRYWRSVARASATDLMESMPMIIRRSAAFDSKFGFYSFCENRTYRNIIVPENNIGGQMMFWLPVYSRGNLIMRKRGGYTPIVVNPWTSATWEFPATPIFWLEANLSATPTSPDCVLVLSSSTSIQWCRIGGSKWSSWTQSHHTGWFGTSALALRNKVFWSDYKGRVLEMDMLDHSYTTVSKSSPLPLDAPNFGQFRCIWPVLVDISGELLMIDSIKYLRPCAAFRLDFSLQNKRWVKVDSLGFHAVVVSHDMGEAYDTRIVKGLVNNCVYYHDVMDDFSSFFKTETTLLKVELGN